MQHRGPHTGAAVHLFDDDRFFCHDVDSDAIVDFKRQSWMENLYIGGHSSSHSDFPYPGMYRETTGARWFWVGEKCGMVKCGPEQN